MSTGVLGFEPAPPVLPRVKRLIVCSQAYFDLEDERWTIKEPWAVRFLKPGDWFPLMVPELSVYIQLSGGVGEVRLGIELRRKQVDFRDTPNPDHDFQVVYRHVAFRVDDQPFRFPEADNRLTVYETMFRLTGVPFPAEGVYEFRVITPDGEGHKALDGLVAEVTLLDPAKGV